jgi:hypothetical protein
MARQPTPPEPKCVFISYVREDIHRVRRLTYDLKAHGNGIRVWRDTEELWPGQDWKQKIRDAISDGSFAFIACFSSRSIAKPATYQNEELLLAIEQMRLRLPGTPWLIPVRFDDCALSDLDLGGGRSLNDIQRVDLFGNARGKNMDRLIQTIENIGRSGLPRRQGMPQDPSLVEPSRRFLRHLAYGRNVHEAINESIGRLLRSDAIDRAGVSMSFHDDPIDPETGETREAWLCFAGHERVMVGFSDYIRTRPRAVSTLLEAILGRSLRLGLFITSTDPSEEMMKIAASSPGVKIELVKWADKSDGPNIDKALMSLHEYGKPEQ